jgi:hypothetical protein
MNVVDATDLSIRQASHLSDADAGAVAVLRGLSRQVDYLLEHDGINESGKFDNVSPSLYLKYCESLGLTPAGRKALGEKKTEAPSESSIAKRRAGAAKLRSV